VQNSAVDNFHYLKKYPLNKVKSFKFPHGGTCSHQRGGKRQTHAYFACWAIKEQSISKKSCVLLSLYWVLLSIHVFFFNQEIESIPQLVKILIKIHFAVKPPFSNWETILILLH